MKMAELESPVIYGLGLATSKELCAAQMRSCPSGDGRYIVQNIILSRILDGIGLAPCLQLMPRCFES